MDIRSLACFIAVADALHFRKAAERMHLTQPALSQRIRALEEEVGTTLLDRDRRHVALTPAGKAFLEPARIAVAQAGLARSQALRAVQGEVGRLRLGFTVIAFYGLLPQAVRLFRARHPDVDVELVEMNSPSLEQALAEDRVDLAILHPPLEDAALSVRALPNEKMTLAIPAAHPLARKKRIAVSDLEGQPYLIAPRAIGPGIYDRVIAMFREQGISPRVVQEVTPMTTLTGLVATGAGMGLVTEGIATVARPGVVFRPLRPAPPELPVAAAWRGRDPLPAAAAFLRIVAELARERH